MLQVYCRFHQLFCVIIKHTKDQHLKKPTIFMHIYCIYIYIDR